MAKSDCPSTRSEPLNVESGVLDEGVQKLKLGPEPVDDPGADSCSLENKGDDAFTSRGVFPEEVVVLLMTHLDGVTLLRCRLVSKTWNGIFERSYRCLNSAWKRICHEEIPDLDLNAICSSIDAKFWMPRVSFKWHEVYRCWKRWKSYDGWRWRKRRVKLPEEYSHSRVTCLRTSGKLLLISTGDGDLLAYDPILSTFHGLYSAFQIKEFYLLAKLPKELFSDSDFILEGLAHDELVIVGSRKLVRLNFHTGKVSEERNFGALFHPFGHFLDEEVIICQEGCHYVLERKRNFEWVTSTADYPVEVVAVREKSVVSLVKNVRGRDQKSLKHFLVVYRTDGKCFEETARYAISSHFSPYEVPHVVPIDERSFIFYQENILTFGSVVGASSKMYDTRDIFQARVTHVAHHCGVIFFGTDSGVMFTLVLKDSSQLLSLERQSFQKLTVTQEEAPICKILVQDDVATPIIWVAMSKKLYMLIST